MKKQSKALNTVVGDNINIMKMTFECNIDYIKLLNSMDSGYTKIWKQRKDVNLKSFILITC